MCSIPMQSDSTELLQEPKLIVWDEALAQHRHYVEAVDRTLRDIMRCPNSPWLSLGVISDNVHQWCPEAFGQQSFLRPFRVRFCGVKCVS